MHNFMKQFICLFAVQLISEDPLQKSPFSHLN